MKILFIDFETAPSKGYFYGRYDINISPQQIVQNGFFLCYQAAWDDGPVFVNSIKKNRVLKPEDDKKLCVDMVKLLEKADRVVAHNAFRFDIVKLNARLAFHGLPPFRPRAEIIDTLRECRKHFMFEANSLNSVCRELKLGYKFNSGGMENTIACMDGDMKAWKKLLTYGKQDVVLLRKLYHKILPWIKVKPTCDSGEIKCPRCHSTHLVKQGLKMTLGGKYQQWQCKECGGWTSSKFAPNPNRKYSAKAE